MVQQRLYNVLSMPKFDLSKTQETQDLFVVAREQRDQNWKNRFYEAIVDASMATTPSQVIRGPDGFPYFVLNLPPVGQPFETFCLSHIVDVCLENGFGVVIQPDANPPQWVFTYGHLWSLKEFGAFEVDQATKEPGEKKPNGSTGLKSYDAGGRTVFVGQPSASFFPAYARKAIKQFLVEKAGNANPNVLLMVDPQMKPDRSLVFSIFVQDFNSKQQFDNLMYRLTWYLPRHYGLVSISKDSEFFGFLSPL